MGCPVHGRLNDVPADRVVSFNYRTGEAMVADPWTVLHDLGTGPGFFYSPELGGHWCAAKRETVIDILRNCELFSNPILAVLRRVHVVRDRRNRTFHTRYPNIS